jgi:hypothetical protein
MQPIHYLERALEIAIGVGDEERTSRVVDAMFDLHERIAKPELAGSWPFLYDNLLDNKKITLTHEQREWIIRSLEEMLRRSVDRSIAKAFNPWGAQAAAERLAGSIANRKKRKKRALSMAGDHVEANEDRIGHGAAGRL